MEKKFHDYNIYSGLNGGFGGASYVGTIRQASEGKARDWVNILDTEAYESYEGLHGLLSFEEALEEAEGDRNLAYEIYNDAVEDWAAGYYIRTDEDEDFDEEIIILD